MNVRSVIWFVIGIIITVSFQYFQQSLKNEISVPKAQITELDNKLCLALEKEKKLENKLTQIEAEKTLYENEVFDLKNQLREAGQLQQLLNAQKNGEIVENTNSSGSEDSQEKSISAKGKNEKPSQERFTELLNSILNDNTKINGLIALLNSSDTGNISLALRCIKELGQYNIIIDTNSFLPSFLSLITNEDGKIRRETLLALPAVKPPIEIIDRLLPLVDDTDPGVREFLSLALTSINSECIENKRGNKTETIVPIIEKLLADKDSNVVKSTLRSYWRSEYYSKGIEDTIIVISKEQSTIKYDAISALSRLPNKSENAIRRIVEVINDANCNNINPNVLIERLSRGQRIPDSVKASVADTLFMAVNDSSARFDYKTKMTALNGFRNIGTDYSKVYLKRIAESNSNEEIRKSAERMIPRKKK
jgi:hypothetical protein